MFQRDYAVFYDNIAHQDEYDWFGQFYENGIEDNGWFDSVNAQIKAQNIDAVVVYQYVDPINLEYIHDLADKYQLVHVIADFPVVTDRTNVLIHRVPISYYGRYYIPEMNYTPVIEKDFNCLMNRLEPIRQAWFYLLFRRGWLDRGYVSFNMYLKGILELVGDGLTKEFTVRDLSREKSPVTQVVLNKVPQVEGRDYVYDSNTGNITFETAPMDQSDIVVVKKYLSRNPEETFDHYHKTTLSSFDSIYDDIKKIVPFRNFDPDRSLRDLIMSTKFSIVIETCFHRVDCPSCTEKTWRVIQLPRPWLLFASTGTVKVLRNLGFDVFDDYVDHAYDAYDTSTNCVQRQEGILAEAERLMDLEINQEILIDWENKARHNRAILKSWHDTWKQDLEEKLKDIKQAIFDQK